MALGAENRFFPVGVSWGSSGFGVGGSGVDSPWDNPFGRGDGGIDWHPRNPGNVESHGRDLYLAKRAQQLDRLGGFRSAARPELMSYGLNQTNIEGMKQWIRDARAGRFSDRLAAGQHVSSDPVQDPIRTRALLQLEQDFAPLRAAQARLLDARATGDHALFAQALDQYRAQRKLNKTAERRQMTLAELESKRPGLFNRLSRRAGA